MKTYRSQTEIVISVRKAHADKNTRVRFEPFTLGGSMFATDDHELQDAIERHRYFGSLFILDETPAVDMTPPADITARQPSKETASDHIQVMDFESLSDAKDHIAEAYGVSRTSMRTKEQIETAAAQHGLTIRWQNVAPMHNDRPRLLEFV